MDVDEVDNATDIAHVPRPDMEAGAIPVRIVREPQDEQEAALYAAFIGYNLTGSEAPFQLLPQDRRRSKAIISVGSGIANHTIIFCSQAQAAAAQATPNGSIGFIVRTNTVFPYESQAALWCVPVAGQTCNVSVIDQRYGTRRD